MCDFYVDLFNGGCVCGIPLLVDCGNGYGCPYIDEKVAKIGSCPKHPSRDSEDTVEHPEDSAKK
jgi:hypothetical protein